MELHKEILICQQSVREKDTQRKRGHHDDEDQPVVGQGRVAGGNLLSKYLTC